MKTTKQLIDELSKYSDDLGWYVSADDDEFTGLYSDYTGDIANAQAFIQCDDNDKDESRANE